MSKRWLLSCLMDWTILIFSIALSYINIWLVPISILIVGNRQHALAILGHDGAHRLAAKNKFVNDSIVNLLVFYPMGLCLKNYRDFHWKHHRKVGTSEDPEIPLKEIGPFKMSGEYSKPKLFMATLCDLFGFGIPQLLGFLIHVRPKSIKDATALIFVLALSSLLVYNGLWLGVGIWFVALFTSFWACFRLRVWSEHVGGKPGETLTYDEPSLLQKIIFLPHNTWLHHEHHVYPGVPFYNLKQKRKEKIGKDFCDARSTNNFEKSKIMKDD